ncbi:MAG: hypothetical protein GEV11_09010 [Streptosporangiales bacterium]|nr:hypothetical protein [Streptosporangiales bacterium]
MNQELAAVSAAQGGPFRVAQARESGYTQRAINRLVATGEWTRLRRGVCVESGLFAQAGDTARRALEAAAAVLALNAPGAVCSHESAAVLHGIALLWPPPAGVVSLTRPPGGPGSDRLDRVRLYRAQLPGTHVLVHNGVPVTSPARTAVDLARNLPFAGAVVAVDSALGELGVSRYQLLEVALACRNWPGIRQADQAIAAADPRSSGPLGTLARLMCAAHGLPAPKVGVHVSAHGCPAVQADLFWPEHGVVVLVQEGAGEPPARPLEHSGFTVIELTWDDVTRQARQSVQRIRRAFYPPALARSG